MPVYAFHCDACKSDFDEIVSMSNRDKTVACPKCGSKKTGRKLSAVAVGAGKPGESGGHVHSGGCGCGRSACDMNWGDN
jgi:putative FmdB family regulatory protein